MSAISQRVRKAFCNRLAGGIVGIDISGEQIAAARRRCANQTNIEAAVLDVRQLPYAADSFDAFVAIQVIEYLDEPLQALTALRRVVTARARAVIVATNWDAVFWNTMTDDLTRKVQLAWRQHCRFQIYQRTFALF